MIAFALCTAVVLVAHGASAPSSSLLANALRAPAPPPPVAAAAPPPASMSLFYVPPPEPRSFQLHDLVQIIVRETSTARSSHELETEKEFDLEGEISDWPHLSLTDLLNLQLRAGKGDDLPRVGLGLSKEFTGEGEYERRDDLVGRISAEVIEVLPNGNLVLESRTMIATDEERQEMRVTGICRPADVTAENSILSSQIHDLRVEKVHSGELKKANEKGIVTKFFDFLFAW